MGGVFVALSLGSGLHVVPQTRHDFIRSALQELHHLMDHLLVARPAFQPLAWPLAPLDVIVQADFVPALADGIISDAVGAGTDGEDLMQHLQGFPEAFHVGVRPQVAARLAPTVCRGQAAVKLHPAGEKDLGIRLIGDPDKGVGLVVLEAEIVPGLVVAHQVLFGDKGLRLAGQDDPVQVGDLGHHTPGFNVLAARGLPGRPGKGSLPRKGVPAGREIPSGEVGPHPVAQDLGLADINDLSLGVFEEVNARRPGQALELVLEGQVFWHESLPRPRRGSPLARLKHLMRVLPEG
ncbi:hypothetical protein ES703_108870 [subsurface metagenome]